MKNNYCSKCGKPITNAKICSQCKKDMIYTAKDLQEFAEWCNVGEWFYYKHDDVWMKHSESSITRIYGTCKIRERWEIETGRRVK